AVEAIGRDVRRSVARARCAKALGVAARVALVEAEPAGVAGTDAVAADAGGVDHVALNARERVVPAGERRAPLLLFGGGDRPHGRYRAHRRAVARGGIVEDAEDVTVLVFGHVERTVFRDHDVDRSADRLASVGALLPAANDVERLAAARDPVGVDRDDDE